MHSWTLYLWLDEFLARERRQLLRNSPNLKAKCPCVLTSSACLCLPAVVVRILDVWFGWHSSERAGERKICPRRVWINLKIETTPIRDCAFAHELSLPLRRFVRRIPPLPRLNFLAHFENIFKSGMPSVHHSVTLNFHKPLWAQSRFRDILLLNQNKS